MKKVEEYVLVSKIRIKIQIKTQTTLFCVFMFNLHQYIKVNNGVFCSKSCSFRVFLLPLHPQKNYNIQDKDTNRNS